MGGVGGAGGVTGWWGEVIGCVGSGALCVGGVLVSLLLGYCRDLV